jgi:hypothetical protein
MHRGTRRDRGADPLPRRKGAANRRRARASALREAVMPNADAGQQVPRRVGRAAQQLIGAKHALEVYELARPRD